MSMHTQAHTQAGVNAGILAMRAANAAKREFVGPPAPKAERKPKQAPKPAPAPRKPEDADEPTYGWRVCVLVSAGDSTTHVWVAVDAAGPRRASGQARAEARRAGHEPVGVCAVLREDAPEALLALAV